MTWQTELEEVITLLTEHHVLLEKIGGEDTQNYNKMAYEMIRHSHLHMPTYF